MARQRPKALVTAPVAGPGLDLLRQVADVVVDPWIDHQPLRIYNAEQLADARPKRMRICWSWRRTAAQGRCSSEI